MAKRYEVISFHEFELTNPNIDVLEAESIQEASRSVARPGWIRGSVEIEKIEKGHLIEMWSDEGWHYAFVCETDKEINFDLMEIEKQEKEW